MSEETVKITSEAALMMDRMVGLDPHDARYKMLKSAIDYKASWLELAERLNTLAENKDYKEWGYKAFKNYCLDELQLSQATARKLVRGFQWIDQEAPALLPNFVDDSGGGGAQAGRASRVVPDVETVDVLVQAQRAVSKERLAQDDYDDLKARALKGEQTTRELKESFREAVTQEPKPQHEERLRLLRRSLSAADRIATQLEELGLEDPEVLAAASTLRDKLFDVVSGLLDQAAYAQPDLAP